MSARQYRVGPPGPGKIAPEATGHPSEGLRGLERFPHTITSTFMSLEKPEIALCGAMAELSGGLTVEHVAHRGGVKRRYAFPL